VLVRIHMVIECDTHVVLDDKIDDMIERSSVH
jgi:hypothetical protein